MNKLILIVSAVMTMLLTSVCSAMTISQPIQMGKVSFTEAEDGNPLGFTFEGATSNDWKERSQFAQNIYTNGIASWRNASNKLYVHYSYTDIRGKHSITTLYGDNATENTVKVNTHSNKIFSLNTDKNITLYLIDYDVAQPYDKNFTLIGKRQDDRFVKYFDARTILDQYCGTVRMTLDEYNKNPQRGVSYFLKNIEIKNDTIIMPYYKYYWNNEHNHILVGEIRCKWDENAQWFALENVVY